MLNLVKKKEKLLTNISMIIMVTLFLMVTMLAGCNSEEGISPFASPETIAKQLGKDSELVIVDSKFRFSDLQVDQPVKRIPIPVLGTFIGEFANTLTNFFLILNNDWDVSQDANFIEIPNLDPLYIKSIEIKNIELNIVDGSVSKTKNPLYRFYQWMTNKRAKLDFIKKIDIYIATEEQKIKVASYRYNKDKLKKCNKKCINFHISRDATQFGPINLMPILQNKRRIYIYPEVDIHSAPRRKFNIEGKLDFRIKLKLPF